MQIISGSDALCVAEALVKAGAMWTPYFRRQTDANGVMSGEPVRVGCILGKTYIKGQSSNLKIDIPGVIVTQDVTRFEGVVACEGSPPEPGDLICMGSATDRARITCVNIEASPLVVLTLDR
ncbi:MAG: hypothetical protein RR482_00140 [Clostridia bacterium]